MVLILLWAALAILLILPVVRSVHLRKPIHTQYEREVFLSYYKIAAMEYAYWGQTFHNPDPAPGHSCACDTCTSKGAPIMRKQLVTEYIHLPTQYSPPPWADRENPDE